MTEAGFGPQLQADPEAARLMRRAAYAAVAVAGVLILAKLVAWTLTGSVAMLSTLIDSMLDALASGVNLFAVHHATQPADREHRFGHGKAEAIAGLGQAAFVTGSAVFLLFAAGHRLFDPVPIGSGTVGIAVMLFSIAMTVGLVTYQRKVIRRTGSVAISADSLHYLGDVLVNVGVIVSLLLAAGLGLALADPIFGIAIALYILSNAWVIAREALDILMDRELDDEDRQRIVDIARSHPEVLALHDLRSRRSGTRAFIQVHLEMDGALSLYRAHAIADQVEAEILEAFPNAEVIIHQDPAGIPEDHPHGTPDAMPDRE